ncbi:hypothetical protein J5U46_02660 [Micromonospora tulbaghiae]|uniref:Tripartite tricarboxylate transporter TctB family protein n=1 Tax=Micromonospora tulbaghiae TaxID=479978 RepID=A0AAW4JB01_9ACTN|nr:hypothetical protein [Micromonospora tulbaghiae]MBO4139057.1 hypothetical protein [Micromonospora tulbaghiae]MDX5459283.1 hypothetical protein [Micromonospora tulbaghiae]SCE73203.1 hypothetical protein GA0070562_2087 [Micromonospora tulbaghiae]
MDAEFAANAAATAAIFGVFGMAWFGWAQEAPPKAWRPWLGAGSVLSLTAAVVGGIVTVRTWDEGSSVDDRTGPIFGVIVLIEVVLCAAGAIWLRRTGRAPLVPAWIALIVGLHFFPLAPLLGYPALAIWAALVTLVAVVSVTVARRYDLTPSAVVGAGTGATLLIGAVTALVHALT